MNNLTTNSINSTQHQTMADQFRGKYRIKTTRLKNYDYSTDGYYFVTICVKNNSCLFGNVNNGKIALSETGKIAEIFWQEIPDHFPFIRLDEFIIMPNHIHGIIIINRRDVACNVSTEKTANTKKMSIISPKRGSLSSVIRSYKSNCTKTINKIQNKFNFQWQPRFYDHIIRDEKSLHNIREYIIHNPLNWDTDEENPSIRKICKRKSYIQ